MMKKSREIREEMTPLGARRDVASLPVSHSAGVEEDEAELGRFEARGGRGERNFEREEETYAKGVQPVLHQNGRFVPSTSKPRQQQQQHRRRDVDSDYNTGGEDSSAREGDWEEEEEEEEEGLDDSDAYDTSSSTGSTHSDVREEFERYDILKDSRFYANSSWFGDLKFAFREYVWGPIWGLPKHCKPTKEIEANVVRVVEEAEREAAGNNNNNKATSSWGSTSSGREGEGGGEDDPEDPSSSSPSRPLSSHTPPPPQQQESLSPLAIVRRLSSKPNIFAVRFLAWLLSKVWRAAFQAVYVRNVDSARDAIQRALASPDTAVIILPTHRSHADYLLLSYLFFGMDLPVPLIAAGNNLNVPILGSLLVRSGAFFIRRDQGSARYRLALQAYLSELTRSGTPVEFFVEGGRSRRGNIGKPKLGLLGMIVDMVREGELRDAILIPASLDYDCVPEAGGFANEVLGVGKKKPESLLGTLRAFMEWLLWGKRGGNVYVSFSRRTISVQNELRRSAAASPMSGMNGGGGDLQRAISPRLAQSALGSTSSSQPEQHHHHAVPPPLSIFRGGSNVSIAGAASGSPAGEIGSLLVHLQRECGFVSIGGIVATALLMGSPKDIVEISTLRRRSRHVFKLLSRIPGVGLHPWFRISGAGLRRGAGRARRRKSRDEEDAALMEDVETEDESEEGEDFEREIGIIRKALEAIGGDLTKGDARERLLLRYSAAPVVCRLLPAVVVALRTRGKAALLASGGEEEALRDERDENEEEMRAMVDCWGWIASMYDIEIPSSKARLERLQSSFPPPRSLGNSAQLMDLCTLVAPVIETLSATVTEVQAWRANQHGASSSGSSSSLPQISESDAVSRVKALLTDRRVKYPEAFADLEIVAALKGLTNRSVLRRVKLTGPSPAPPPPSSSLPTGAKKKEASHSASKEGFGYEVSAASVASLLIAKNALKVALLAIP